MGENSIDYWLISIVTEELIDVSRKKNWLVASVAIVAAATVLTLLGACASDDSTPAPTSISTAPTTTEDPAQKSSEEASWAAHATSEKLHVSSTISAIEAQINLTGPLDDRLSIIITAYCNLRLGDGASSDTSVSIGLGKLYDNNWRAGGHWSHPLDVAAQQEGACPTPTPTTPQGPVG